MTRGYYGWLAGASLSAFGDTALFVASTPGSHLSRLQSLLVLAQTVPLIVSNNLLGVMAGLSPGLAVLVCGVGMAGAGVSLLAVRTVRTAAI
ncbi:hypothetical protein F1D05_19010 [Kribbella qitaiheensis]|uniref:Uncharacterized protein n=1 Tax=Kribbella qitaiheensis TaxID=1544730 RepID=A0A7G6X058_9ACTN|nr:hypothetical protein [Kribbella qitaiheensis]QNE19623.1 hypothetical protein F1D05_19010 [Kribbella qitaiheensis]